MAEELCNCGSKAVWCYLPGYSSGGNSYHCEKCVPRGCECNYHFLNKKYTDLPLENEIEGKDWKWIEKDKIWVYIDEEGREYPCCEYDYEIRGFEKENF